MRRLFGLIFFLLLAIKSQAQITITQFPYFNGFEDATSINDWTNVGAFDWTRTSSTSADYNGQSSMYSLYAPGNQNYNSSGEGLLAKFESPTFQFDGLNRNHVLSLDYKLTKHASYSQSFGTLLIQIKVGSSDWFTLSSSTYEYWTWKNITLYLSDHLSADLSLPIDVKFRIVAKHDRTSVSSNNVHMYVDNFHLSEALAEPMNETWSPEDIASAHDVFVSAIGHSSPSYNPDAFIPSNAFDGNSSTAWVYNDEDAWIEANFGGCSLFSLSEYNIAPRFHDESPTRFWLYGATSADSWEEIDYRTGLSWSYNEVKSFSVTNNHGYSKFRLDITDSQDGISVDIREIGLIGRIAYKDPTVLTMYSNNGELNYNNGISEFDNNASKAWLIKPMDGTDVRLTFYSFDLNCPNDIVRIYDGDFRGATLLGEYRTTYMPEVITSSNKALYVEFLTSGGNGTNLGQGFTASYVSTGFAQSTYPWTQVNDTSFVLDGRLGINTPFVSDEFDLLVNGGLVADELVIESLANAPDYVFEEDYDLKTLEEVRDYIDENGHLPEVPSAAELEESGMSVSEMNLLLLKKIEELTLYMIELDKLLKTKDRELEQLHRRLETIENMKNE